MAMMPFLVKHHHSHIGTSMICQIFGRRLWDVWQALSTPLQGPSVAVRILADSIGAALMLIPAGAAWPNSSAAVFDWVKAAVGLAFILWRHLSTAKGGRT